MTDPKDPNRGSARQKDVDANIQSTCASIHEALLHGGVAASFAKGQTAAYLNEVQEEGSGLDGQLVQSIANLRLIAREEHKAIQCPRLATGDARSGSSSEVPATLNTAITNLVQSGVFAAFNAANATVGSPGSDSPPKKDEISNLMERFYGQMSLDQTLMKSDRAVKRSIEDVDVNKSHLTYLFDENRQAKAAKAAEPGPEDIDMTNAAAGEAHGRLVFSVTFLSHWPNLYLLGRAGRWLELLGRAGLVL
jgi:hypothetical protein